MDETTINRDRANIECLDAESFRYFCSLILETENYAVSRGRRSGSDGGLDLYGKCPNGEYFGGHCTTQGTGISKKLTKDIAKGVKNCKELEVLCSEIRVFSIHRQNDSPGDIKRQHQLQSDLSTLDPRYASSPPRIIFKYADCLAEDIHFFSPSSPVRDFLARQFPNTASRDEAEGWVGDGVFSTWSQSQSLDLLVSQLKGFPLDLPPALRAEKLRAILATANDLFRAGPFVVSGIAREEILKSDPFDKLLQPALRMATLQPVGSTQIDGLFAVLSSHNLLNDAAENVSARSYLTRVLRNLLFTSPQTLLDPEVVNRSNQLFASTSWYWRRFFTDIWLRVQTQRVNLTSELSAKLQVVAEGFRTEFPDDPISVVWPYLTATFQATESQTLQGVVSTFCAVAVQCTDHLSARWCLSALSRSLRVLAQRGDPIEYDDERRKVLSAMPSDLCSRVPALQFAKLSGYLRTFLNTRDLNSLKAFESEFLKARAMMFESQVIHLQVEYAAILYRANEWLTDTDIMNCHSHLAGIRNGVSNASNQPLFKNDLIDNSNLRRPNPNARTSKARAEAWLRSYVSKLVTLWVDGYVSGHHLRISQFPALEFSRLERQPLSETIRRSLERSSLTPESYTAADFAASCASLDWLAGHEHTDLMQSTASKALEADIDSIRLHADSIGKAIHRCFYYGKTEHKAECSLLSEKLWTILEEVVQRPQFYWAFHGSICFGRSPIEREFLLALQGRILKEGIDRRCLTMEGDSQRQTLSANTIQLIRDFAAKRSLMAAALSENMLSSELWNLLGTTALVNRSEAGAKGHETTDQTSEVSKTLEVFPACFYAVAIWFAREEESYDGKYQFNFIHSRASQFLGTRDSEVDSSWLLEVARYFATPEARSFAYHKDRSKPYFELVEKWLGNLKPAKKSELKEQLCRCNWTPGVLKRQLGINH